MINCTASLDELAESLHCCLTGLTEEEAQQRLQEFGQNTIIEKKGKPLLFKLLKGFVHCFALILWCGAAIAFFADWKSPGEGMNVIGFAMLGVIFINGIFSYWQERQAEEAIAALRKLIPHTVKVMRGGKLTEVAAALIVPGDLLCLQEGDDIPADCRLVESSSLRVNNSTLTGESFPQSRDALSPGNPDPLASKNIVLAGTSIFAGHCLGLVYSTGMRTEFGKIARMTQSAADRPSPLQKEILRLSRVIALIATAVGLLFYFVGQSMGISFWDNIVFALGIIVALVPEGLLPEVTLALATCSGRMARRNALVRNLSSVETLGCASVICTDKTGTLTQNKMTVKEVFICGQRLAADKIEGVAGGGDVLKDLALIAFNCENTRETLKDGKPVVLGDSMEVALVQFASTIGAPQGLERIDEIPFDTDRKRVTTINKLPGGETLVLTKGALEQLLPLCTKFACADGDAVLDSAARASILDAFESMTAGGLRVIVMCRRKLPDRCPKDEIEKDYTLLGLVGLHDPPRVEVADAIERCQRAGIKVIMLTGDHQNTATAIASEIGLFTGTGKVVAITGQILRTMSETQLELSLRRSQCLFARIDAEQKLRVVLALQRLGHIVAVTGDGVNDAPALKAADIGVAMGRTGTDVAREAADMILTDDNFASIVNAIEEGRAVFSNIRKFLTYVLSSNIAELIPYLAFVLFNIPLPLTVIQVLSIDLCADVLPALALGGEMPEAAVMAVPPRTRKHGLFDLSLLARAYLYLGAMVSGASMFCFFTVLTLSGWHQGVNLPLNDPRCHLAQTACLVGIMCMQMVNSGLCRSEMQSLFSIGFFSNKLLNLATLIYALLILAIVYLPCFHVVFQTASLPAQFWLLLLPCMAAMFAIEEVRKFVFRLKGSAIKRGGRKLAEAS